MERGRGPDALPMMVGMIKHHHTLESTHREQLETEANLWYCRTGFHYDCLTVTHVADEKEPLSSDCAIENMSIIPYMELSSHLWDCYSLRTPIVIY